MMTNALQQQLSYFFTWSSNQLIWTSSLSSDFLLINSISLCFDSWIFYHPLTSWLTFSSFWLFLVLFWMLWMLVTMFKACLVAHASRITTWGTLFTEILFSLSKEWIRSWPHTSLITYDKTFAKKLKAIRPKPCREGGKEKERQLQSVMR